MVSRFTRIVAYTLFAFLLLLGILLGAMVVLEKKWGKAIVNKSLTELNKHLLVPVSASDADFTFFRNFPHASVHIENVVVQGVTPKGAQDGDTLLVARDLFLVFNPFNLLRGSLTINALRVEKGYLNLQVDKNGHCNYHILPPADTMRHPPSPINLHINQIALRQISLGYHNQPTQINTELLLSGLNAQLKIKNDYKSLIINANGLVNILTQGSFIYANRQPFEGKGTVGQIGESLSMQNFSLTINRNQLNITGQYNRGSKEIELTASSQHIDLPSILAFTSQYKWNLPPTLQVRGGLNAQMRMEGSLEKKAPLSIDMTVEGNRINAKIEDEAFVIERFSADFSTQGTDLLTAAAFNVRECRLRKDKSSASLQFKLSNLQKPSIYAQWACDLKKEMRPIKALEKYNTSYDYLKMEGELVASFPELDSLSFRKAINPRIRADVEMQGLAFSLGEGLNFEGINGAFTLVDRDITKGLIEGKWQQANFSIALFAKDFITATSTAKTKAQWTVNVAIQNWNIPDKLALPIATEKEENDEADTKSKFNLWEHVQLLKGDLTIDNSRWRQTAVDSLKAQFNIEEKRSNLWVTNAALFNGKAYGSLTFNAINPYQQTVQAQIHPTNINLPILFRGFNNFKQKTITAENIEGNLSGQINLQIPIDSAKVNPQRVRARANLVLTNGELNNVQALEQLGKFIALEELMNLKFSTLTNSITIQNGRVIIPNMRINSSAIGLSLSGEHYFNGRYAYHVRVGLSELLFNTLRLKKKSLGENFLENDTTARLPISLYLLIEGDATSAYVRYDSEALKENIKLRLERERASLEQAIKEEFDPKFRDSVRNEQRKRNEPPTIIWDDDAEGKPKQPEKKKPKQEPQTPTIIWQDTKKEE